MEPIIECKDIEFSYNHAQVLNGISISINKGDMIGVLGANGAGKSTLLKIITGILEPKSGNIRFKGEKLLTRNKREIAKIIAYIPQDQVFAFPFTVTEVILLGRAPYIGRFEFERDIDRDICSRAMETVGISHLQHKLITAISAGERQLVSLARALVQQPEVMILDEPATFLDVKNKTSLMKILSKLKIENGITIIAATHDIFSALWHFDNIKVLKDGNIYAEGKTEDVITSDILSHVYDINVTVKKENGKLFVFPED